MADNDSSILDVREKVANFVEERDWEKFHTPKNLSMSIAIEAAELMEIFQWMKDDEANDILANPSTLQRIREELADILIYSISLSNTLKLDISEAISEKLGKNSQKYPIQKAKGLSKKYTEL